MCHLGHSRRLFPRTVCILKQFGCATMKQAPIWEIPGEMCCPIGIGGLEKHFKSWFAILNKIDVSKFSPSWSWTTPCSFKRFYCRQAFKWYWWFQKGHCWWREQHVPSWDSQTVINVLTRMYSSLVWCTEQSHCSQQIHAARLPKACRQVRATHKSGVVKPGATCIELFTAALLK